MQFLKTLFWILLTVILVLFARENWQPVTITLWGGLQVDIKLPILVLFAFLLGFVPTMILYRARLWSMQRRLELQDRGLYPPTPSVPPPYTPPRPERTVTNGMTGDP